MPKIEDEDEDAVYKQLIDFTEDGSQGILAEDLLDIMIKFREENP